MSAATVGSRVPVLRSFSEGGPRDRTILVAPKCTARRRILVGMGTSPAVLTETVRVLQCHGAPLV